MLCTWFSAFSQTENPELAFIGKYISNEQLNIAAIRKTADFLTNSDLTTYEGKVVPRRKKAVTRHVKQLNELLEQSYYTSDVLDSASINLLIKLEFIHQSFINKINADASPKLSFRELVRLGRDTRKSKQVFKFKIDYSDTAVVSNSVFWQDVHAPVSDAFDTLAKAKKIKVRQHMAVIFSGFSYTGSAPKINTTDLNLDDEWVLKWGDEVHSDVVGSRIFAAMGYDVDHPYFFGRDELTLVLDGTGEIKSWQQLRDSLLSIYAIDLQPFYSTEGTIDAEMITVNKRLAPYLGCHFVTFKNGSLEARPDRVKRLGSFLPDEQMNQLRPELRASLLVHAFIGNWDTREENTLLTNVHHGDYRYSLSAVFSDLGTSFGVKTTNIALDFKVGLVNEFGWEVARKKGNRVIIDHRVNALLSPYRSATYADLKWMAHKIASIDSSALRAMVAEAKWPQPIEELYFHKLASRRASILNAFEIVDPHPIRFDRKLTIKEGSVFVVKDGKLVTDYKRDENPESFYSKKGRKRNYGN